MLNWDAIHTYNYIDKEFGLMLCRNPEWYHNIGGGRYEAIARNFVAYVCYNDKRLIDGILRCWEKRKMPNFWRTITGVEFYYQGYPYPDFQDKLPPIKASLHLYYTLFALKYSGASKSDIKEFIRHIPFRLAPRSYLTLESILWMMVLTNGRISRTLYYMYMIPKMLLNTVWNRLIYRIADFEEEYCQYSWVRVPNDLKPDRIKTLANMLYPVAELHGVAWQLYFMPDGWAKRKLQSICLKLTPRYNYAIKLLLGSTKGISRGKVFKYRAMYSNRWHNVLNPWINNRDADIINDDSLLTHNVLDVDYVRTLFNKMTAKTVNK